MASGQGTTSLAVRFISRRKKRLTSPKRFDVDETEQGE